MSKHLCLPVNETIIENEICPNAWTVVSKIGEKSAYGDVWTACCENNCKYVLKYIPYLDKYDPNSISSSKESIINEIKIQNECSLYNLSPKIIDSWLCEKGGAIVMESMQITASKLIEYFLEKNDIEELKILMDKIYLLINSLHNIGIYHGDAHLQNIMANIDSSNPKNYNLKFIDMGKSGYFKYIPFENRKKIVANDYYKIYINLCTSSKSFPQLNFMCDIAKNKYLSNK